jgi:hypothetical protein
MACSIFFNPSKKNSFGFAANRKIGNRKSQRFNSTSTYKANNATHITLQELQITFLSISLTKRHIKYLFRDTAQALSHTIDVNSVYLETTVTDFQ